MDNLLALHVRDVHVEGSGRATALSRAAVSVLLGVVDLLAQRIEHFVLVCGLEASEGLQELDFLNNSVILFVDS